MTASLYRPRRQQHPSQGHAPQFMAQNIFQMSSFYGRKMKMKMKKLQYSQVPSYVTLCLVQRLEIACNCIELEVVCLKIFPTWKLKMYWKHIFTLCCFQKRLCGNMTNRRYSALLLQLSTAFCTIKHYWNVSTVPTVSIIEFEPNHVTYEHHYGF